MKKIGIICLVLALLMGLMAPLAVSAVDEEYSGISISQGCHTIDAKVPLLGSVPYTENAKSVILYEYNSDTLMYAYNPDEQLYPSSFVKIMTAYIAAEEGSMTDVVTVRQEVLNTLPDDAVTANLQADEVISLQDLMYCMMVHSANDAASVIADHISGSQDAFVAKMNAYAAELGCTGTKFMNPHGLHHEEQVTTARDTAKILAAAMKNEVFAEVFNTAFYTVPATNKSASRRLETINHLINNQEYAIYYDDRVTGGRTGVTDDGYRCVAAASEADGLQMVSVVMGTHSEFVEGSYVIKRIGGFLETSQLLDIGYNGYKTAQILYENQVIKQQSVANGSSDVMLGCTANISTVLPAGATTKDLIYRFNDVAGAFEAPIERNEVISQVEVWYGSVCLGHADLIAMNAVYPTQTVQTNSTQTDHSGPGFGKIVLWTFLILLSVAVVFVAVLIVIRRVRRAAASRRGQKYRRSRRRSR